VTGGNISTTKEQVKPVQDAYLEGQRAIQTFAAKSPTRPAKSSMREVLSRSESTEPFYQLAKLK
jgi:hypothetical protein